MRKLLGICLLSAFCFTALAACGSRNSETNGKTDAVGEESSVGNKLESNADSASDIADAQDSASEPQRVYDFTMEDVLGCWYSTDANGNIYCLRIREDNAQQGNYPITLNRFGDIDDTWECSGAYWHREVTNEDGELSGMYTGLIFFDTIDGDSDHGYSGGAQAYPLDDGTLYYLPDYFYYDKMIAEYKDMLDGGAEDLDLLKELSSQYHSQYAPQYEMFFTRELPVAALDVTDTTLSGLWYGKEGDDAMLLMVSKAGSFVLWQTDGGDTYPVTGTYEKAGSSCIFTVKTVEGEIYTDADVSFELNDDNTLTVGETTVISPMQCTLSGKWSSPYSDGEMTLEISESGLFRLAYGTTDSVGVCFCEGETISLLYLMDGGHSDYDFGITGAVTSGGGLTLTNRKGESLVFTQVKD